MDKHQAANYAISALLAGYLAAPTMTSKIGKLDLAGMAPQKINLYCIDSQFPKCVDLAKAFRGQKWEVTLDLALIANQGVGVNGPPELAKAVGKAFGVEVKQDTKQPNLTVWVGRPED